jgi:vitamin K-dependent gamma-carboxylase-like protein
MTRLVKAWERFWFEPRPTSTLALVRIAFGFTMIGWTLSLLPSLFPLFGSDGILPEQPAAREEFGTRGAWGLLDLFPGHAAVVALFVVTLVASVCLMLGYRARIAAVLVFVAVLSFERRNPFVFDSGDALIRIIALYLALTPAGASLSLDRARRARDRFWEFPSRTQWGLRLMQVQLSVVYLSTVWAKARGTTWNDGTAVSYALRVKDIARFGVPDAIATSELLANLMTYGTLAIEFALGVLVWNRRARPWVLGLGVVLHLGIDYSIRVGFFTLAMFVLYLAFVPQETASRAILAIRDRVRQIRARVIRSRRPLPSAAG